MRASRMLAAAALIGVGLLAAWLLWALVREPILAAVYGDVAPLTFATDLREPLEFRARILDKRQ